VEFNLTSPLEAIRGRVTPAELFFVRNHFSEPDLTLSNWTLQITGRVARPLELDFSDLLESPTAKLEAVVECAGNPASGSAVSNGVWEGVPLARLLARVKPEAGVQYVLLEGADTGSLSLGSKVLPYSRMVPLSKCLDENSLLVYKLNNRFLPRRNGFPARALLPGWYAMDSVKWLRRIVLLESEAEATQFYASGMDQYYVRLLQAAGGLRREGRVSKILVKSVLAYPKDGAKLPAAEHSVWGFAWTGSGAIYSVEISVDGGLSWGQATLESEPKPLTWTRWSYRWKAAPGEHKLVSRARDRAGREQPLQRDPARGDGYELNWCAPVNCAVR
jgi:DMSO/TMAO reductase YedYZ molybdopterin-dependent catalytic subunit